MRFLPCLLLLVGCAAAPAAPSPARPLRVVLDGNSLSIAVNGVPSYGSFLSIPVTNLAIGGQSTRDMLRDFADVEAAYDPAARNRLVVWEATNDLYFGASPDDAVDHLRAYVTRATALGYDVVLLTVLPRASTPDPVTFERDRLRVNDLLRASGLPLLDVGADAEMGPFPAVLAGVYYQPDKVHLTEQGARRIAARVESVLH